jgi:hypothetical protein
MGDGRHGLRPVLASTALDAFVIYRIGALLLALAGSLVARPTAPFDPGRIVERIAEIARNGSEGLSDFWRETGMSGKVRETTATATEETSFDFTCSSNCSAEVVGFDNFLAEPGTDALVKIQSSNFMFSRFVLEHKGRKGWRVVDYVDSLDNRYGAAQAKIIPSAGRRWLVITSGGSGGTGVFTSYESWYELSRGRFVCVLEHVAQGHDLNLDPAREFFARFMRHRTDAGRDFLEFTYHVSFTNGFGTKDEFENRLWEDEWTVTFSRPTIGGPFRFDAKGSQLTRHFVDAVFDYDTVSESELVRLLAPRLLAIAHNPADRRRRWLRDFLDRNAEEPEAARIHRAMANSR